MRKERLDYRLAQAYMFGSREECLQLISLIEKDSNLKIEAKNSVGSRLQDLEKMLESEVQEETKKTRRTKNDIKNKSK